MPAGAADATLASSAVEYIIEDRMVIVVACCGVVGVWTPNKR